ncbi:hypothetical protein AWB91_22575 [Mycobacterium paraense]|uniref:DUF5666 domain-containing protein n=1 Tax=Mycobacterium paraense TaxID=767916 RepID=A0A1X2AAN6_9MYCO|nr:hypothetical protein [Mycobacterium paraense]ORW30154.1 hypothetical protein AWB91_22575 [Mycobacterium paraense]ORW39797.1 hypothetical protein AWB88_14360 [Mycobacterium paraense]ORW47143.1 hypothetical protein AWB90_14480 [Mycobacterium paraense]
MGAKHRLTEPSEQTPPAHEKPPRKTWGVAGVCEIVTGAVVCAACLTALVTNTAEPEKPTIEATLGPAPVSQPVRQEGTVIAVSADSVTARSADGYTQTYLVTPNTAFITNGARSAAAAAHFAVNDHVDIIGTIRNGRALATAVADRDVTNGNGSPMDHVAAQPVSAR